MELVQQLTQTLGISEDQATGGAGLIFKLAKDKLGGGEFSQIADAVPGMDNLLGAAPESGGAGKAMGALGSALGGGAEKLGGVAALTGGFSKLGLDSGMVGKFMPVILSFVQSKGGESVKNLLGGVLK